MPWTPASGEVEDGTGLSTAIVPESPATSIAWLNDRGKTAYSSLATDALQKQYALLSVEQLQDFLLGLGYEGQRLSPDQGLLFPAAYAYNQEGVQFDLDQVPGPFLEAYRLAKEEMAAGTWMTGRSMGLLSEWPHGLSTARVKARSSEHLSSLEGNHPEIYQRLRRCLPPARWAAA